MILVKVERMFLSNMGFIVLLKGDNDERSLPIFIGAAEAHAIALWINKIEIPRPLTHDLLKNILDCVECRIHRVEVSDLIEGTFYANIVLESNGVAMDVDARPSDAIALALRTGVPIYVSASVMAESGKVFDQQGEAAGKEQSAGTGGSELEKLRKNLDDAVVEERYEDAAGIRDKIRQLEQHTASN